MLFLFEYRGARLLIVEQFPDTAGSIISFRVDSDIVSLDGKEPLQTEAEIGEDGKLHVTVRKSTSSRSEIFSRRSQGPHSGVSLTPRPSNLTNAEIYSLQSSRNPTPRGSSFNHTDFYSMVNGNACALELRHNTFFHESKIESVVFDVFDLMILSGRNMTNVSPRHSNFGNLNFDEESGANGVYGNMKANGAYPAPPSAGIFSPVAKRKTENGKDLHIFANRQAPNGVDRQGPVLSKLGSSSTAELNPKTAVDGESKPTAMPPASVMTRLILIMVWRKLIRNPNTYSSLIGLTWSLVSFKWNVEMPAIIAKSIAILSDAGLGMAMFSL
ncbi:hypothetical protein CRG98_005262, partial [Punica granatum]